MKDEEHVWPTWDTDPNPTGEQPAVDAQGSAAESPAADASPAERDGVDQPTQAMFPVTDPDLGEPGGPERNGAGDFAGEETPTVRGVTPVDAPEPGHTVLAPVSTLLDDGVVTADDLGPEPEQSGFRTGLGKAMMVTGAVLGLMVLVYGADLLLSAGDVPRGVLVAGVDVGGLSKSDAESTLRGELEPRLNQPVTVKAGDVQASLDPVESGLGVDWQRTLDQAGRQPLSPITRITSFFTTREVGIVGDYDEDKLRTALRALAEKKLEHPKREGTIKFEPIEGTDGGVKPVAVEPRQGQRLSDLDAAVAKVGTGWLAAGGVSLPVDVEPVKASAAEVRKTLDTEVIPAVAAPVTVKGDGADALLRPADIGRAFVFSPQDDGTLKAKISQGKLKEILEPQLASTEEEGQDAKIVFAGGRPTVEPSKEGVQVDWAKTLKPAADVLKQPENRELEAVYEKKKPEVTTEQAEALGIKEVVAEFTTGGFKADSGQNIKRVAEQVYGAIVKPGDVFSLNGHTGARTAAQGYVDAGIIQDGIPGRAVGGGISQFATTLYNASYFAGMTDVEHKEHSFYISRYPVAREATVFEAADGTSLIDLKFRNDSPTGVAIQTIWSPSSITVKLWGTKRYRVESITGPRTNVQKAPKKTLSTKDCEASPGIDGFTATDTRVVYDVRSGAEVSRRTRTVKYNPKPEIICSRD